MKIFLLLFILSFSAFAQDNRWIDIEWEEVPGAATYEVQLFENSKNGEVPRGKFKVDSSAWSQAVPPGKYSLQIRSLDKRGVPGEWSEHIPVSVHLQNPRLLVPGPRAQINSSEISLEWTEVEGAAAYQVVVKDGNNKVVHNASVKDVRNVVYLDSLGEYLWTVYAIEEGETLRQESDFTTSSFRNFFRVGNELLAPEVKVTIDDKITLEWNKVRNAQNYAVNYLPPAGLDKSRRFNLPRTSMSFKSTKIPEGITTITVNSTASGYQDSPKTVVQLKRKGQSVELQDLVQGNKSISYTVPPAAQKRKNEVYVAVALSKFSNSSRDIDKDTDLNQKELTGGGLTLEYIRKPHLNSLQQKYDLSYLQLSTGREVGNHARASYSLSKEYNAGKGSLALGGGLTYLKLMSFFGNRFSDDIHAESTQTLGPHVRVAYSSSLSDLWGFQAEALYSYQMLEMSSDRSSLDNFGWMNLGGRFLYYISNDAALFAGVDWRSWKQKWSNGHSDIDGFTISLGLKAGF